MAGEQIYIGIDESSPFIECDGFIVAIAVTDEPALALPKGYNSLRKSRDFLNDAPRRPDGKVDLTALPSIEELTASGLVDYGWARIRPGRFNRTEIELGMIVHLIMQKRCDPENTHVIVDGFSSKVNPKEGIYVHLHMEGFPILYDNIDFHDGGDKSVPIVNYADIIAFRAAIELSGKYRRHKQPKIDAVVSGDDTLGASRVEPITIQSRENLRNVLWSLGGRPARLDSPYPVPV